MQRQTEKDNKFPSTHSLPKCQDRTRWKPRTKNLGLPPG